MNAITERDYLNEVAELAVAALERVEAGEEASDVTHELCDDHQWIIYTFYHHQVLQHSNQELYADIGGPDLSKGWDNVVMVAAYLVLEADVAEELQRLLLAEGVR